MYVGACVYENRTLSRYEQDKQQNLQNIQRVHNSLLDHGLQILKLLQFRIKLYSTGAHSL